ncbi:hypothetical protein BOTBODRAFT_577409 [Botryobasidium botryosum FD-172 SS1]|uniref:Uncharacterized protein n=1 Tax=Botryobasidium botryosum (strain FD-172 SS1) TaxID=930990 RepID=A0A067N197_BOTB1|nr:hypothetical protein BOTBODRAFT_577409 [Botryobasidium botryosum FD-172 SS1]
MDEATRLRDKCGSFRILVMGRANAGKTTILQAVCGTTERPDVYDPRGRKIRAGDLVLIPNTGRGGQNIENEIRFPSNPGFVFHDSSGFESGSTEELGLVRAFINHRAAERTLKGQLHAIWFCLPMDNDARMLTTAELEFFHRCDTGKVPVIAIFTKFDSLDAKAFIELFEGGVPFGDAQDRAPYYAEKRFDQIHLPRIRAQKYPPAKEVRFRNMHENGSTSKVGQENIADLLKKTTDALTTDVLKLLLVSVQQNNVELCMENAVKSGSITKAAQRAHNTSKPPSQDQLRQLLKEIFAWFPYAWAPDDVSLTIATKRRYTKSRDPYFYEQDFVRASFTSYKSI